MTARDDLIDAGRWRGNRDEGYHADDLDRARRESALCLAAIIDCAPPTGSPIAAWQGWCAGLTATERGALEWAAADAMAGARPATRHRMLVMLGNLPAPMVHCLLLRGVRDRAIDDEIGRAM